MFGRGGCDVKASVWGRGPRIGVAPEPLRPSCRNGMIPPCAAPRSAGSCRRFGVRPRARRGGGISGLVGEPRIFYCWPRIKSWASPNANLLPEQGGAPSREDVAAAAIQRVIPAPSRSELND